MKRDVMRIIREMKQTPKIMESGFNMSMGEILLIIDDSKDKYDLAYDSFLFGFRQGMKFAKKEGRQ